MKRPSVSVIIPCYNRQDVIRDAIESALSQTDVNEVVVVDDGSTDLSWERIAAYGSRVKPVRTENCGPANARNIGAIESSGDWIKFLDSDDLLIGNAVTDQLEQISELPAFSIPVGDLLSTDAPDPVFDRKQAREIPVYELGARSMQVSRPLIPRTAFDETGGFRNSSAHEDFELMIRLSVLGWRFFAFKSPVVLFRNIATNRLSDRLTETRFCEIAAVYRRLENELFMKDPSLDNDLRRGVAVSAWSMARRAARLGYESAAKDLFDLATRLAGTDAWKGVGPIRLMYSLFDPVQTEKLVSAAKSLINR